MRHRVKIKHFNRDSKHRKALLTNLIRFLIENGEITTTKEKAKEVKRLADKVIAKAQTDDLNTRRQLHKIFGKRDVVNTLVDVVAKKMSGRNSGFTTIVSLGKRRGDNSEMAKLSLVEKIEKNGLKKTKDAKKKEVSKKVTAKKAETKKAPVKKADAKKTESKKATAKKETKKKVTAK